MKIKVNLTEIPEEDFLVGRLDLRTVSANENIELLDYLTDYQKAIVKAIDLDGKELRKTRRMVRNLPDMAVSLEETERLRESIRDLRSGYSRDRKQVSQDRDSTLKASAEVRDWIIKEVKQECCNKTKFLSYRDESRIAATRDKALKIKLANSDYRKAATEARKVFSEKVAALDKGYAERKAELRNAVLEAGMGLREEVKQYREKRTEDRKAKVAERVRPGKNPQKDDSMPAVMTSWKYRSFMGKKQREHDKRVYGDYRKSFNVKEEYLEEYLKEDFALLDEQTFRWWNKQRLKRGNLLFTPGYALVDCMVELEQGWKGEPITTQWEVMGEKHRRTGVLNMLEFFGYESKELLQPQSDNHGQADGFEDFEYMEYNTDPAYIEGLREAMLREEYDTALRNALNQVGSEVRVRTGATIPLSVIAGLQKIVNQFRLQKLAEDII